MRTKYSSKIDKKKEYSLDPYTSQLLSNLYSSWPFHLGRSTYGVGDADPRAPLLLLILLPLLLPLRLLFVAAAVAAAAAAAAAAVRHHRSPNTMEAAPVTAF